MGKIYFFSALCIMPISIIAATIHYPQVSQLGPDDTVWQTCEKQGKALFYPGTIEQSCTFLEQSFLELSKNGCSQKSLGLGFKGAVKHFQEQDQETQQLINEIRKNYLECRRHNGNEKVTETIKAILPNKSNDEIAIELSKIHALGNKLAFEYGEYFKKERPEQIKREKEQKEKERNKF